MYNTLDGKICVVTVLDWLLEQVVVYAERMKEEKKPRRFPLVRIGLASKQVHTLPWAEAANKTNCEFCGRREGARLQGRLQSLPTPSRKVSPAFLPRSQSRRCAPAVTLEGEMLLNVRISREKGHTASNGRLVSASEAQVGECGESAMPSSVSRPPIVISAQASHDLSSPHLSKRLVSMRDGTAILSSQRQQTALLPNRVRSGTACLLKGG